MKENQQAQQEYTAAVSSGHGAYLLKSTRPDCFEMTVGNLPPMSQALIQIDYVTQLTTLSVDAAINFVLPTAMAPRYHPIDPADRDAFSGPVNAPQARKVPYGLLVLVNILSASKITNVTSQTHDINAVVRGKKAKVTLDGISALDGNFSLSV